MMKNVIMFLIVGSCVGFLHGGESPQEAPQPCFFWLGEKYFYREAMKWDYRTVWQKLSFADQQTYEALSAETFLTSLGEIDTTAFQGLPLNCQTLASVAFVLYLQNYPKMPTLSDVIKSIPK
jgi:hypothetical protein